MQLRHLILSLLLLPLNLPAFEQSPNILNLGIYAYRTPDVVVQQYQGLANFLDERLPNHRVVLHPLSGSELQKAVRNNQLDMLFVNPNLFETIRHEHSLTGAVATVQRIRNAITTQTLGGVIITLAQNNGIKDLKDLRGQTIAVPSRFNTGAYLLPLYELKKEGIPTETINLLETGTNDAVIKSVLNRQADAGFIRTGILEALVDTQALDPTKIKVIHKQKLPSFPYHVSTHLYPEWPFVVMSQVSTDVQRQIISALFELNRQHPAAQQAGIAGFIPPLNYRPVQQVLQELRLPPYDQMPEVTPLDIFKQYQYPIVSLATALLILVIALAWISRLNLNLKETMATVKKQKRTLNELVDGTRAGTWEWHVQNGKAVFNERWAQMLGYTLKELEPISIETWMNLTHPDDLKESDERLKAHFRKETSHYECEARMRHRDGHWIWVYDSGKVHKWTKDGQPLIMSGTHVDITSVKENERLLELKTQRDDVLLKLPLCSEKLDEEEFLQFTLAEAERLTGSQISFLHMIHEEAEIELLAWSKNTVEHFCNAEFERHYPISQAGIWADAVRNRTPVVINDYASHPAKYGLPHGHAPLSRFVSVPVIENGQVVMITGIGNKTTEYDDTDVETLQLISNELWRLLEHKKTLVRLKQAANVFNTVQEGILITDPDGVILDANHAFSEITGYTLDEIKGKTPSILNSGRHDQDFYKTLWNRLRNKGDWSGEIWNKRKDGEIYPQRITINSTRNAEGKIQQYIALVSDISTEKKHLQQLEHLAHHDKLTGLPNRALLTDRVNQAIKRSERNQLKQSVVFIDLDGFKAINDQYGHEAGDALLKGLAKRFMDNLREEDTIARIGGDEFIALVEDLTCEDELKQVLDRLLKTAREPIDYNGQPLNVSASLGAYLYQKPASSNIKPDADQLLREADQAMYQAKNSGKNCYVVVRSPFAA